MRLDAIGALALAVALAQPASAQLPDAETFLRDLGFSADQISQVKAGSFVEGNIQPSNERELVVALAFLVQTPPTDYADASPDGDLNLSAQEVAAFDALGSDPTPEEVEAAVKKALMARLQAYQTQGLAGIAPYARGGGKLRSPADDLRSATAATKKLEDLVPNAYQALLAYPNARPAGFEDVFDWSHYHAHGVPTIALTHTIFIPEGPAWVVAQRQFYVSGGYNSEQAISGFLPMQQGTLVVYTNRTSTDQVTGFGGSAKRAIGSKLLASELEKLYGKVQAAEKKGGS